MGSLWWLSSIAVLPPTNLVLVYKGCNLTLCRKEPSEDTPALRNPTVRDIVRSFPDHIHPHVGCTPTLTTIRKGE